MKKHKYLLLLISLSLLIPTITYADCTKEEIDNFKKIEDEYKVTYEFDIESKKYTLYLTNPISEKYTYSSELLDGKYNIILENESEIKVENVDYGKYEILIVGTTESCYNDLKKINIDLPKYNQYYNDPLCEGIEEFVLCQPTYDKDIDYNTFVSRVNSYKNSLQTKTSSEEEKKNIQEENEITQYIKSNLFEIIIILIFIAMIIVTIILTANSVKKSRRLE